MTRNNLSTGATRVLRRGATRMWRRVRTGTTLGSFAMLALAACSLWLPVDGSSPGPRRGAGRPASVAMSVTAVPTPREEGNDQIYAALRRLFPADWEHEAKCPHEAR